MESYLEKEPFFLTGELEAQTDGEGLAHEEAQTETHTETQTENNLNIIGNSNFYLENSPPDGSCLNVQLICVQVGKLKCQVCKIHSN